ncbi:MAG TPA: OmpW family outer membrane protein [Aquabacterium sp.]|uniref:OmpW/AlkL family protein n=1 Tax=Aquabacterium sp. TaxID=1872578 RepID=UPI002E34F152|nr:OmpW family outer membrane protein [Aquabacterium sp.]HEX5371117.1 OmpW family outer membrane protein [Aquabacterium sp.]
MNRFGWSRACVSAAVCVAMTMAAGVVRAEDGGEDSLSLKIAKALRSDRLFVRAGGIYVKIKTKSGDTYDVTGPVMTTAELENVFYNNTPDDAELTALLAKYPNVDFTHGVDRPIDVFYTLFSRQVSGSVPDGFLLDPTFGLPLLTNYLRSQNLVGIGTPPGITGAASPEAGTAGVSLGYYLDDDYKWLVESYILAAPISTSVSVRGTAPNLTGGGTHPIAINGAKIITTKIVPPLVMFGRYWGDKSAKFRPYTGVAAMYAMFMDTKATQTLNNYVGGSNPGDTTVSLKNAFGMGPVVGMKYQYDDKWHASLNVGLVKLKTQATLTTRNTYIASGAAILNDLGAISEKIATGEGVYGTPAGSGPALARDVVVRNGGLVTMITKGVIADRFAAGQGDGKTLGTYVRKTDTELTNTIFMFSVGRTF